MRSLNAVLGCLLTAVCLLLSTVAQASYAIYEGRLGTYPISFVMHYDNGVKRALYAYDRYRTPITLKPAITHEAYLGIDELDVDGLPVARFHFTHVDFFRSRPQISGQWVRYRDGKSLPLELKLKAFLETDSAWPDDAVSLLQAQSSEQFYFQVPLRESDARVLSIDVMEKSTGKRLQVLPIDGAACWNQGVNSVKVFSESGALRIGLVKTPYCAGRFFVWNDQTTRFDVQP
ncbi:hypothetical protein [Pseudomonas peli]|uniref:hypothetical protein n=1 Tax=Pseudomonas peli TaxID=592361 RepID=UPI003D315B5A